MKRDILMKLYSKMIPKKSYCVFRENGKFSVITVENVQGPLPINATAAKILTLCDDNKNVIDIFEELKNEYKDVNPDKLFNDLTFCIRNLEIIEAIKIKYI